MGEAYIMRRGGSVSGYAVIGVTFPSGAAVSCKDSSDNPISGIGSGTSIFYPIPANGTYTVSATGGGKTASQAVTISAKGQCVAVTLAFGLNLVVDGVVQDENDWISTRVNKSAGTGCANLEMASGDENYSGYRIPVDFGSTAGGKYTTLSIDATCSTNFGRSCCVGIAASDEIPFPGSADGFVGYKSLWTQSSRPSPLLTIDVSGLTGTKYVGIYGQGNSAGSDINAPVAHVYSLTLS